MTPDEIKPNSGRKLFFGLFVFPLLIAVGMAVFLCSVIFLTHEDETADSLIIAIKTGPPSKKWQKAFELSNELNRPKDTLRSESVMKEIIHILLDTDHYDPKTRGYMAVALSHFNTPEAIQALRKTLDDENKEVRLYTLWALGVLNAKTAAKDILPFLKNEDDDVRKMSVYILGTLGGEGTLESVKPLLNDRVNDVRWNAALTLARLGDDSGFDILTKMLERGGFTAYNMPEEQVESVMINATKGLALIRRPESIKILESVSRNEKSLKVRQAAIDAIRFKQEEALKNKENK